MADKLVIKLFLQELQAIIKSLGIIFYNRPKNSIQNLADLSITPKMREEIILNLEVKDYSEGPLEETQQGGTEMWVFGKVIKGQQVYIKLTISKMTGGAVCISFHKAEHPMEFPLKKLN
ncbi:type II toxin-antitoxin system MqsR family toxin [Psychroserpens sp. Hel_I_66]|uniref:type II toxin-antitoxin system MqsR family toxin n=1 Tax=Psychroserpens sp. Hel_I_66 TaxID=1250004 RepID=UPI0006474979|nr:type II toxin-antitoxin system MqsR family toxin [Psychroserpens sp. Hel_I_66]